MVEDDFGPAIPEIVRFSGRLGRWDVYGISGLELVGQVQAV